ncbi:MAG: aminoglycoside phosphotransferase family protein [Nocardioides sp.]|nr:aminoglycoside phosphotransferase family protein [Nocardioides sp.]
MPATFTKRRVPAQPGSIPDQLQMFVREVRFYREIAPTVGVRVPACGRAEEQDGSTLLELEDLSSWRLGADPVDAAQTLAQLHLRWEGTALGEWPWLPKVDVSHLVERLYAQAWPSVCRRFELTPRLREMGDGLVGQVSAAEQRAEASGPHTLVHGDPAARNIRTSPTGEVALLDWEDLGAGPGVCDLAWFLVSSVRPADWNRTIAAYGGAEGLAEALPAAMVQGVLSIPLDEEKSSAARQRIERLDEGARRTR